MADNSTLPVAGGGTETFANDDVGGVKYPRAKLALGADGAAVDAVAGAGAVGTGVQRVTLASDDPVTAAVQIMDDWDESDRAKVNLIAGQAGITAAAGNVAANTPRVTLAADDPAAAVLGTTSGAAVITDANGTIQQYLRGLIKLSLDGTVGEYETVAASQTAQVLGGTGAIGDYLEGVLIVPATTSPGNVIILDNATSITIFAGGSNSVADLSPIYVALGIKSVSGAWKVTTGSNVSCIATGNFSA